MYCVSNGEKALCCRCEKALRAEGGRGIGGGSGGGRRGSVGVPCGSPQEDEGRGGGGARRRGLAGGEGDVGPVELSGESQPVAAGGRSAVSLRSSAYRHHS